MFSADSDAAMGKLVWPYMLFEVFIGIETRPSFEHYDAEAALGEHFGGSTSSCAGPDDADVVLAILSAGLLPEF